MLLQKNYAGIQISLKGLGSESKLWFYKPALSTTRIALHRNDLLFLSRLLSFRQWAKCHPTVRAERSENQKKNDLQCPA